MMDIYSVLDNRSERAFSRMYSNLPSTQEFSLKTIKLKLELFGVEEEKISTRRGRKTFGV